MAKITRDILINAPVEKVFEYHSNPMNQPEYWPSMLEVKDIEEQPGGGRNYNWIYKMAGIRLDGSTETTEFVENERIATKSSGGVESTFVYAYKPEGAGTRLTMELGACTNMDQIMNMGGTSSRVLFFRIGPILQFAYPGLHQSQMKEETSH
jgi:uncharacterized protein YndB with AHSA1/START domain